MVLVSVVRVGMDQYTVQKININPVSKILAREDERARATVHSQPGQEGSSLVRVEGIDFEHRNWMRADRFIPESVYPQLRELPPNALMQLLGKLGLCGCRLHVINVEIKSII